jgi:hypothetical protein
MNAADRVGVSPAPPSPDPHSRNQPEGEQVKKIPPPEALDAIAQRLGHIPLVAMHSLHHELQGGINQRPRFFGIESLNQRRGAFEIGKEGGDGLAFTVSEAAGFQRHLLG